MVLCVFLCNNNSHRSVCLSLYSLTFPCKNYSQIKEIKHAHQMIQICNTKQGIEFSTGLSLTSHCTALYCTVLCSFSFLIKKKNFFLTLFLVLNIYHWLPTHYEIIIIVHVCVYIYIYVFLIINRVMYTKVFFIITEACLNWPFYLCY